MGWFSDLFDTPTIPDPNAAAVAGAQADLELFPFQYQINSLAKMGGKGRINGVDYDFSGLGDADVSAAMSEKMAETMLALQQEYGPEFVKQRLAELKAADPTGYAARQQLFDRIMADAEANPNRPMNQALQDAVQGELSKAGKLDARQIQEVQQGVRGKQIGRGIILGNAAASEEANALVGASEQLRDQRQQQASGFLNSGVSPEDVQYRQIQQALSNLGAFTNGQTPTAQFGAVSSAANGAAPLWTGSQNQASTNGNATAQGMQDALSLYSSQMNWANSQVNPWMAGIAGAASGVNLANQAGWN